MKLSSKLIVAAGRFDQIREWAHRKEISMTQVIAVTPNNIDFALAGCHGLPHVILCGALERGEIQRISEELAVVQSDAWEEPDVSVVADLDRLAALG